MSSTNEVKQTSCPHDAAALHAAWCERVGADGGPGDGALALVEADTAASGALVEAVLSADGALDESTHRAAASVGRAAGHAGADLKTLHGVFDELHDALFFTLFDGRDDDAGRCVRAAARAIRPVAVAVEEAWFDERGRAFRHDIKTPLQAASLNLELLALESDEKGLDTEALDVIQRSLDQAVELLRALEPVAGH